MNLNKIVFLIVITLILLIGGYLRLVNLTSNPNGLYVDEAATGYNAWSILLTGRDEYGKEFPVALRFFGSYTPPLYTYLTTIPIFFLGLSVVSVRLISAISGILLILVFFYFIKSLDIFSKWTVFITTFLFATVPWTIFYSRVGYEVNLAFLLYSLGVLFLWLSLKKSSNFLIVSASFLAVSTYAYHTQRLLAPLTILLFLIIFKNKFLKIKNIKILSILALVYLLISLPQLLIFFTPANSSRGLGLFYAEAILSQAKNNPIPGALTIPVFFIKEFSSQYLSYLNPRNLFFQPDSDPQRSFPELSVFYPWMVILYFLGIWTFLKNKNLNIKKFILMLLIVTPIPASFAKDPFSTQRSLPLVLPLMIIFTFGVEKLLLENEGNLLSFGNKKGIFIILIFTILSFATLYRSMAVLMPNERATNWGYGFDQLAQEIKNRPLEEFLIDTSRMKPVYIELAFFLKYPPDKLQQVVDQSIKENYYHDIGWDNYYKFQNIETRAINWEIDIYKEQILVGDELAISVNQAKEHFLTEVFTIKSSTNEIIFQGFKTNPVLKCQSSINIKQCQKFSI